MTVPSPEGARDALVEAIARALYEGTRGKIINPQPWETIDDTMRTEWRSRALVALTAALAARQETECETCGVHRREHLADNELHPCCWPCQDRRVSGGDGRCFTCGGSGSRSVYYLDVLREAR